MAFAVWTRPEGILFAMAITALMVLGLRKSKNGQAVLIFVLPSILVFIFWQLNLAYYFEVISNQPIHTTLIFEPRKLIKLLVQIVIVLIDLDNFAYTILLFFICVVSTFYFKSSKSNTYLLAIIFLSFLFYVGVYYQLKADYEVLDPGSWVLSSFKRGMFMFIPLMCCYIAKSAIFNKILGAG
jgi:hypothetical protein